MQEKPRVFDQKQFTQRKDYTKWKKTYLDSSCEMSLNCKWIAFTPLVFNLPFCSFVLFLFCLCVNFALYRYIDSYAVIYFIQM